MIEPLGLLSGLAFGAVAGGVLALAFFGGLWLTVRRLPRVRRKGPLLLGSFLVRAALVTGGFCLVTRAGGPAAAAGLAAFVLTRNALVRRAGATT